MLLNEKLKPYRLLLASQSPRRCELMTRAGFTFDVTLPYKCDEVYPETIAIDGVAKYLSELKSRAYPTALCPNEILITADTVVVLGDNVLGKPSDEAAAREMLRSLSGREHRVITGVTLRRGDVLHTFDATTKVHFRDLTREEIEHYITNYKPFDKAGSYGIQEWIGYTAIEHIEGSFYNVMGLPIQKLYTVLDTIF